MVYTPYEFCGNRAVVDGFSEKDFKRCWKRCWKIQMDIEEKVKYAGYVIDNSGELENTQRQVREVFERLKEDP